MARDLNNVHGDAEVWRVEDGNRLLLVWYVPGTDPPVPIIWEVPDTESRTALFGPGQFNEQTSVDRRFATAADLRATGAVDMGTTSELRNPKQHPWEAFLQTVQKEAEIAPWLLEPDFLAILAGAMFEGRAVTQAEIASTDWWKRTSDAQREWAQLWHSDRRTARQELEDRRLAVRDQLRQAGIYNPPDRVVEYMADARTRGDWSDTYLAAQVNKLAAPTAPGVLDEGLGQIVAELDNPLATRDANRRRVAETLRTWLGPSVTWSDSHLNRWADRLATDPNGQAALDDMLSKQRMARYQAYTDPTLTYEDIAGVWRDRWAQMMGELPDEAGDPVWNDVIAANSAEHFDRTVRQTGLQRGNPTVRALARAGSRRVLGGMVVGVE